MADVKVSALAAGTAITDADLFYYVDGATSKSVTALILQDYVLEGADLIVSANSILFYSENTTNSGTNQSFYGFQAGYSNTTGSSNTFLGYKAGYTNTTKQRNVYIGTASGRDNNEDDNVLIGYYAGISLTGGTDNVIIGSNAVSGSTSLTVSGSVIIGKDAGLVTTANDNVFIGHECGEDNTSGTDNVYIGYRAGANSTTASRCIYIGHYAGEDNNTNDMLFIDSADTSTPLIGGDFANNRVGINLNPTALTATLGVGGNVDCTGGYGVDGNPRIDGNGYFVPLSAADASAPNNSIYYSTTASKLVYKDGGGSINALY